MNYNIFISIYLYNFRLQVHVYEHKITSSLKSFSFTQSRTAVSNRTQENYFILKLLNHTAIKEH